MNRRKFNRATIENAYSFCTVTGEDNIGGVIGNAGREHNVLRCYVAGNISGEESVGGVMGRSGNGTRNDLYWDKELSGVTWGGDGVKVAVILTVSRVVEVVDFSQMEMQVMEVNHT